ncbi:cytochrome P450 family protein [Streptomyces sp. WMMC897]|uniref:cytochrome P450 family protein n=1 Tax=Streptomyces sp. WMMC897 TaxID=3014782 RepID=UPI0022B70F4A|nr:cytochrome P450 [Streptomyces sp. WMMC897]MCZ7415989.1 cytochrome P450 [Streptomyces sp. WMMC897]
MTIPADADKQTAAGEDPSGDLSFMAPEIINDPYVGYGRLREQAAVVRVRLPDGSPLWLVTRYEDVRAFLRDPRFVHDTDNVPDGLAPPSLQELMKQAGINEDLYPYICDMMADRDPPRHTRLRKAVFHALAPARVRAMRPRMEEMINESLDALPGHADEDGVVDLVEHWAQPMPVGMICELVGVPLEDRPVWREWAHGLMSHDPKALPAAAYPAIEYLHGLIERRRKEPADDLISTMIHAPNENGERLTDVETVGMVMALVTGSHENTAHLVANGTVGLLTHPDQMALLREDPSLIADAVHEFQRWCSPPLRTRMRYVSEELELGGHRFQVGDQVSGVLVSANRDPRKFADPDRLDVARFRGQQAEHLSFGHGVHYCIGAALGLNEAEIAFKALLDRFPGLSLAVPAEELPWIPHPGLRRLVRLPVRLGERG